MTCHPEALLLREGSPAMFLTEMHSLGFSADRGQVHGGGALAAALEPEAFREILRAKEALQDDRLIHG